MESYDTLYGTPPLALQRRMRGVTQCILDMPDYAAFFRMIGFPMPAEQTTQRMTGLLRRAWARSLQKKYHTKVSILEMPVGQELSQVTLCCCFIKTYLNCSAGFSIRVIISHQKASSAALEHSRGTDAADSEPLRAIITSASLMPIKSVLTLPARHSTCAVYLPPLSLSAHACLLLVALQATRTCLNKRQ